MRESGIVCSNFFTYAQILDDFDPGPSYINHFFFPQQLLIEYAPCTMIYARYSRCENKVDEVPASKVKNVSPEIQLLGLEY